MDRDHITRTGAKDPWGRRGDPPSNRGTQAPRPSWTQSRGSKCRWRRCAKGGGKAAVEPRMLGASLSGEVSGKALPDRLAFKPYWGKPTVRISGGEMETLASCEARSAPSPYPTSLSF